MARRETDARNFHTEQPDDIMIPTTGNMAAARAQAAGSMNTDEIELVADVGGAYDKASLLAFYEEKVEIMIVDSNDVNPENYVFLSVNGKGPMPYGSPWVPRNEPVTMARKYVEQLARAKPVSMRTEEITDLQGARGIRVKRHAALRYPFTVLRDPNPKGRAWLEEIMRRR